MPRGSGLYCLNYVQMLVSGVEGGLHVAIGVFVATSLPPCCRFVDSIDTARVVKPTAQMQ
jgi:hypothetical protein